LHAQCPPNIDFEYGSFTYWHCFTGLFTGGPVLTTAFTSTATPPVNGRHNIMSGAGTDYYGGFPVLDPSGGSYAARIGYDTNNRLAERIRYYIRIPTGSVNFDLVYRYAVVLENPPTGHDSTTMPRFTVDATDSATGLPIPCGAYSYVASSALPGFTLSAITSRDGNGVDVIYRGWNTATLNLTGLGGTTVAVDFAAADCSLGGHFGYAYVDMTCGLFQVQGLTCNDTASHVTLSAPAGFEYYHWYDSATFTTLYGSTDTIVIAVPSGPTTLAVVLTPYTGFGCPDTLYTRLSPSNLQLHPMHDTLICGGDSVVLNVGATDVALPLSYIWSGPGLSCSTCANPVAHPPLGVTSTYSVTVTNIVGCTKDTVIHVTVDNFVAVYSKFDDTCHNGNVGWARATVTSGQPPFNYLWTTTPPQTTSTATGLYGNGPGGSITYTVTITDNIGCVLTHPMTIFDGQPTDLYVVSSTNPDKCDVADGSITLDSLIPGHTFTVSYLFNGSPRTQTVVANTSWQATLTGLGRGTYSNIAIVTTHCPYNVVGPVILTDPPNPSLPALGSNSPICVGATLYLTALSNPGVSYSWTGPNGFVSGLQNPNRTPSVFADSGLYRVIVSLNNCFDSNFIRVKINPIPIPSASSNSQICSGDTLKLFSSSSNGASYYVWNGPNGFYSNAENPFITKAQTVASGTYTVTVVLNGCLDTVSTNVVVNQTPGPPEVSDTEYCQNSIAGPFNATGTNLLWYTAATGGVGSPVVPTPPTAAEGLVKYWVSQTSAEGCEGPRALITAQIDYLASPTLEVTDSTLCTGAYVTFTAKNTGDDMTGIMWSFGDGHNYNNANPLVHAFNGTGVYTVTATTLYKVCPEETVSRVVTVFQQPNVYLGSDTSLCPGGEAILLNAAGTNPAFAAASYMWNTGDTHPQIRVTTPGTYYVKMTIDGCAATDTISVAKDCYMDIPNVFTPNGDGMNDYFFPRLDLTKGLTTFNLQIFNRWGQLIFTSSSLDGRGWDGRFNDMAQPEGVYVYIIDATFKDGQKEHHQGNLTLLR
jgi:gliding motility-associated-like protein